MTTRRVVGVSTATGASHLLELMATPTHHLLVKSIRVEPEALDYEIVRLTESGNADVLPSRKGVEAAPVRDIPFYVPAGSSNGMTVKLRGPMAGGLATITVDFEETLFIPTDVLG